MTSAMASQSRFSTAKRWLPVAVIAGLMAVAYGLGLHEQISLQSIAANRAELRRYMADNWLLAPARAATASGTSARVEGGGGPRSAVSTTRRQR